MPRIPRILLPLTAIMSAAVVILPSQTVSASPASVQQHHHSRTVVIDRSHAGWWRGQPDFVAYHGHRRGYAYAPGHGYYRVAYTPRGGVWVVGSHYPSSMRRYVVIHPAHYGLPVAPAGHGWYYAGNNFVLVRHSSWTVTRTVAGGW